MAIQKYIAQVSEKKIVANDYVYLHIELIKPSRLKFEAGQHLLLKIPGEVAPRNYSIASSPEMDHAVELLVNVAGDGKGSKYIRGLKTGDELEFMAPAGNYVISKETVGGAAEFMFVATGSGIAPLRAMILDLLISKKEKRKIWLHWGMRVADNLFWFDELAQLAGLHDNFYFDLTLSRPPEEWQLCKGYVTECVKDHHKDFSKMVVFLCGGKQMIEDVQKLLISNQMPQERIHKEQFYE